MYNKDDTGFISSLLFDSNTYDTANAEGQLDD
jgi:hypothetical protein